jgi:hypothetical protein
MGRGLGTVWATHKSMNVREPSVGTTKVTVRTRPISFMEVSPGPMGGALLHPFRCNQPPTVSAFVGLPADLAKLKGPRVARITSPEPAPSPPVGSR